MADRSAPPGQVTTTDGVPIELAWSLASDHRSAAVVTHPHPLMGGDMHNPVPAGLARGLALAGVSAVRLSFRGSGASGGEHGGGDAERSDVVAAIGALADAAGDVPLVGVGYSFGADVLLAVDDDRLAGVVAIAPPLRILPADVLAAPRDGRPTLVLSPAHDQFCEPERAAAVVEGWPSTTVEPVAGCDHFLAGGVQRVVDRVLTFVDELHR
jgi:alpha/beta superfamily hydrolase